MNILENTMVLPIEFYTDPKYNSTRKAKIMLLSSCFSTYDKFISMSNEAKFKLIKKIEKECLNYTINKAKENTISTNWNDELFQELYHSVIAKITSNIDQNNSVCNPTLGNLILDKCINLKALPGMSSQELYSEKYTHIYKKIELSKNVVLTVKTSNMYRCKRCGKNECTIDNRYNRSLDEGVNLTITCLACHKEWNG